MIFFYIFVPTNRYFTFLPMRIDIKTTIKKNGLSLQEVADILGVARQTLNYHQRRGLDVELSTLQKIADVIGCEITDFFYNDDSQPTSFNCPHCGKKINITK